eukprot:471752_1
MEFSKVYRHNGTLIRWSPDGKLLATMDKTRLIIRDTSNFQMVANRTNQDQVDRIEWSSDSKYIMCAQYKRGCVQVWAVSDGEKKWSATVDEGAAGLEFARWTPDGRHIMTSTEFQLRLTIWSLVDRSVSYIKFPKFTEKAIDFSADGKFLAVAERKEFKDLVGIYFTETWEHVKTFPVDTTDLADLKWSPDDRVICVWDTLLEYKFLVYSPDGRKLASYVAYENALGIKSVAWSPSSQFLSVGSYDECARVFTNLTWRALGEFQHKMTILPGQKAVVYREVPWDFTSSENSENKPLNESTSSSDSCSKSARVNPPPTPQKHKKTKYIIEQLPFSVPSIPADPDKPNPKLGVGMAAWSCDDRFLVTRNDNMSESLWVWDMRALTLSSVSVQLSPIKVARWSPVSARLAFCCANGNVYFWTKEGCSVVRMPAEDFVVRGLRWNPDGSSLVLADKGRFCCCYV